MRSAPGTEQQLDSLKNFGALDIAEGRWVPSRRGREKLGPSSRNHVIFSAKWEDPSLATTETGWAVMTDSEGHRGKTAGPINLPGGCFLT
jgi:hypothetical protein